MKSLWNSFLHQLDQSRHDLLRIIPLDKMEIRTWVCFPHVRHLPPANPVRGGDDPAIRSLPEHFSESDDRHCTAFDQVSQNRARPNGWKLVYVADQNQPGVVGKSPHQRVHQQYIHHRRFIHNQ